MILMWFDVIESSLRAQRCSQSSGDWLLEPEWLEWWLMSFCSVVAQTSKWRFLGKDVTSAIPENCFTNHPSHSAIYSSDSAHSDLLLWPASNLFEYILPGCRNSLFLVRFIDRSPAILQDIAFDCAFAPCVLRITGTFPTVKKRRLGVFGHLGIPQFHPPSILSLMSS